jgi:pimeloyl-ACP methyl ester carboxylesterase
MWLDYDAPDFVDEGAGRGRAEAAVAGLRRFQDGLRATHDGDPAHLTVLGHSYGSLVVGTAAQAPGPIADDVVFVGSPGVGARTFPSQPDAGHTGYWDRGRPALDALTNITVGRPDAVPR